MLDPPVHQMDMEAGAQLNLQLSFEVGLASKLISILEISIGDKDLAIKSNIILIKLFMPIFSKSILPVTCRLPNSEALRSGGKVNKTKQTTLKHKPKVNKST